MRSFSKTLVRAISNRAELSFAPNERPSIFTALKRGGDARAQMQSMGSNGTLYAIVNCNSESLGGVEWKLYNKSPDGDPERRTVNTRHIAQRIWNKPNPFYTRQELVESFAQHLDLVGEGWLWARYEGRLSFPTQLWVIRPDMIAPVPDPKQFVSGYVYTGADGRQVPMETREVLSMRVPNPMDPYRGMGPVQSILTDLYSADYAAQYNANFFRNSAEPGGIIEVPKQLSDPEFRRISRQWNDGHGGVSNAHRVAILENGMKWADRKYSMRDMQFAELRTVSGEMIREAFRFPKAMLGTVEDVNRANAEANEVIYARWVLKPRLDRIKGMLNNDFLPLFFPKGMEPDVEFDYDDPSPEDEQLELTELTTRTTAYKTLIDAGVDPMDASMCVDLPIMEHRQMPAPQPQPLPVGGME